MIEEDLGVDVSHTMAQKLVVYRRRPRRSITVFRVA